MFEPGGVQIFHTLGEGVQFRVSEIEEEFGGEGVVGVFLRNRRGNKIHVIDSHIDLGISLSCV